MHSNTKKKCTSPVFFQYLSNAPCSVAKMQKEIPVYLYIIFFVIWRKASQEQLYALLIILASENNNKVRPESEIDMNMAGMYVVFFFKKTLKPNCKRLKDW